jgi:hypothetical protein
MKGDDIEGMVKNRAPLPFGAERSQRREVRCPWDRYKFQDRLFGSSFDDSALRSECPQLQSIAITSTLYVFITYLDLLKLTYIYYSNYSETGRGGLTAPVNIVPEW